MTVPDNDFKTDEMTNVKTSCGLRKWLPVIGLTFSTFIFNTSEFIPIGLLTDIASDFSITESKAGILITVYAWVVALASLPLMMAFSKTENKKLLLSIVALFTASHILSGFSSSYYMLMASRIGVACAHAIFWSMVTPLAVRVAPEGKRSVALSFIITGSSVAMIVGLPLGRAVGLMVGWRATFLLIGAISALILVLLAIVLPKAPSDNDVSLKSLPALIKRPVLIGIYLLTVITITGHFTVYSYIEPFLGQVAGLSGQTITLVLSLFGVMGIIGSFLFSRYYDRHRFLFIRFAVTGICVFIFLLAIAAATPLAAIAVCVFWGLPSTSTIWHSSLRLYRTSRTELLLQCPYIQAFTMSV